MRMELALPNELENAKKKKIPLCIPVGVIEYHAAHCALGTDTIIPSELLYRFEKERDIVVAPPIWYGPASYSVAGPEKNSIDIDADIFSKYVYNILKSLLQGGWRNIYIVILHQTKGYNPTEIACMHAAKRIIFELAAQERGNGWWGNTKDTGTDSPFDWIHVMSVMKRTPDEEMLLDHAAFHETSLLQALRPDAVDITRVSENTEWFCESAIDSSYEHGEELIEMIMDYWCHTIR